MGGCEIGVSLPPSLSLSLSVDLTRCEMVSGDGCGLNFVCAR
jgi:hypothetical protein